MHVWEVSDHPQSSTASLRWVTQNPTASGFKVIAMLGFNAGFLVIAIPNHNSVRVLVSAMTRASLPKP